jgi:hypothetical protein
MVNIIIHGEEENIWQILSWPIAMYSPDMHWTECERIKELHSVQSIQCSDLNSVSVQSNPDALLFESMCLLCAVYMHGVVFTQKNIYKFQISTSEISEYKYYFFTDIWRNSGASTIYRLFFNLAQDVNNFSEIFYRFDNCERNQQSLCFLCVLE